MFRRGDHAAVVALRSVRKVLLREVMSEVGLGERTKLTSSSRWRKGTVNIFQALREVGIEVEWRLE